VIPAQDRATLKIGAMMETAPAERVVLRVGALAAEAAVGVGHDAPDADHAPGNFHR
jgi:hypothetical protein